MNILTFDLEEWFHILNHPPTKTATQWVDFEPRIQENTERILSLLDEHRQEATFFVVAWLAEKYPGVVRSIVGEGHRVGLHSYGHQLIFEQDSKSFREDLHKGLNILSDIAGYQIKMYRAAGFSITKHTLWALKILMEEGIEVDSSVFPAARMHGGCRDFPANEPCILKYDGMKMKELPVNTSKFFMMKYVFSGGGYFRLMPYQWIRKLTYASDYLMAYFHPRDFDTIQPMVPKLPLYRRFMSYYGIRNAEPKLRRWIDEFEFIDIDQALARIDWDNQPQIDLKKLMDR